MQLLAFPEHYKRAGGSSSEKTFAGEKYGDSTFVKARERVPEFLEGFRARFE
jgi:hypothetical protein